MENNLKINDNKFDELKLKSKNCLSKKFYVIMLRVKCSP